MWVGDYPPDIRDRYGPMSEKARRWRPFVAIPFFAAILLMPLLAIWRYASLAGAPATFLQALLTAFIVLLVFNLFDLLVLDWLLFVNIQPAPIILAGTEGMAGYKDYRFHFVGFLKGLAFCLVGGLVAAGLWFLIGLF
jgi:hypothetical protein